MEFSNTIKREFSDTIKKGDMRIPQNSHCMIEEIAACRALVGFSSSSVADTYKKSFYRQ